jgi:diaminohydroxyphosphoribosylaminopyrimidine deaminase/5-amino-6-(5-phosphoribosylamino)uracil reductase
MTHDSFMSRALELAKTTDLARDINPAVGAVVVDANGAVVGEGWHNGSGSAHAEVMAINEAGAKAQGATLYCTLEPCNAQGKTGPCAQAIISAGISKVVIGQRDPNKNMSGGLETLIAAGIKVTDGVLAEQALELNRSWSFAQQNNRPWVIWKTATTLDGFVAATDGTSQWITSEPARERVQEIRASVGAIVTGTGTVLADDPLMTVRKLTEAEQPLRIVVGDRKLPTSAQIFTGTKPGIQLSGDLTTVIASLWSKYGVHRVLVEAGSHLSQSLWSADLVDEVYWFQAPVLLGAGKPAIGNFGVNTLTNAPRFPDYQVDRVGLDLLVHFTTR